jgi:hypothetical protein
MYKKALSLLVVYFTLCSFVFAQGMIIDGNGNIGIGVTSPTSKLDVAGAIKGSSFLGDGSNLTNVPVSTHSHSGSDITTGIIHETYLDSTVARDSELASHTSRLDNPHAVTSAQIGAAPNGHNHDINRCSLRIKPLSA